VQFVCKVLGNLPMVFWRQSLGTTLRPRENSIHTASRPIGLPQIRNPDEQDVFNRYLEARANGVRGPRSTGKDAVLRYSGGTCFLQTLRKTEEMIRNHNISVTLAPSRSKLCTATCRGLLLQPAVHGALSIATLEGEGVKK
jgi:hypothetical protein